MVSIILCEGKTDTILISYYLIKTQGWEHCKDNHAPIRVPVQNLDNEWASWYKRGDDFLAIWGVGGQSNFFHAIKETIEINSLGNDVQFISQIAIITDRDDSEENDKVTELNKIFQCSGINIELSNREWINTEILDPFKRKRQIKVASLVVPLSGPGAMETFLLHVLSGDEDNEKLINSVKEFIHSTESKKFLKSNRQKLKAEFATVLSIMFPEKVFTLVDSLLREIPWEQYTEFQEGFNILEQI
jgi:hypothetical protein